MTAFSRIGLWASGSTVALATLAGCQARPPATPGPPPPPSDFVGLVAGPEEEPGAVTGADLPLGQIPAFPGAEGFGARVTGGRGGEVIVVTTLSPRGSGSLQEALDRPEPRVVVFAVSGVIHGDIDVNHGNLTLAGQSAPGAGITIAGRLTARYARGVDNIIIRHLRVRPRHGGSEGAQFDAIQFSRSRGVIFDHVSASFGIDETIDLYEAQDVTVQWSTISSSGSRGHPEGEHNYGLINGPDGARLSVHHNLFAHHKNRCPAIANGPAEVRNNVAYNVRHAFVHHNPATGPFNIVGNYYRAGSSDTLIPFWFDDENDFSSRSLSYFLHDNIVDDPESACRGRVDDPWRECDQDLYAPARLRSTEEHAFDDASKLWIEVTTSSSADAYEDVLTRAGAFPRDVVTRRAVRETRQRAGAWGARYPRDLMAGLTPAPAPADRDRDGMADAWEQGHGLSPDDPDDHREPLESGYTAIEVYLNELADALVENPSS